MIAVRRLLAGQHRSAFSRECQCISNFFLDRELRVLVFCVILFALSDKCS